MTDNITHENIWIPTFIGITNMSNVQVIPAKAGIQIIIFDNLICTSKLEVSL
jgi:hypothetical protein